VPKRKLTYNDLFSIEQDVARIKNNSIALYFFILPWATRLFNNAANHMMVIHSRLNEIQKKYIEVNEEGVLLVKDGEYVFKKTVTDITNARILAGEQLVEAYSQECEKLLRKECIVEM
jgi:hypothetical protein